MSKTATVRARVEPGLKEEVETMLRRLGLSATEAINLFYSQIRLRRGLPFQVEMPNETTRRTFDATDRDEKLHTYSNLDEMFEALDKC